MAGVAGPIALITLASLATCAPRPRHPPPPSACGIEKMPLLPGMIRTPEVEAQVREAAGDREIRWITPGMAVTEDFRGDRLNIYVDQQGVITGGKCG